MAFGKNSPAANESAPPKKADVILKSTREISSKQDEIIKQAKLSDSRMEAAIQLITKSMQDMSFIAKQSSEIFSRIQSENTALKQELLYLAKQNENIYSGLAEQIAELSSRIAKLSSGVPVVEGAPLSVAAEIDYDKLAEKVAAIIGVKEELPPDYIASKVAEQIVIPDQASVDEEKIASRVAELVGGRGSGAAIAAPLVIDEEELADAIALKTGSLKPEDFEILVDEEGCASISEEIAKNFDYAAISDAISQKLNAINEADSDYDELATRIGEKIKVPTVSEDAIADKAAAALSNYLPEIDTDEIADKVSSSVADVISHASPSVDGESIAQSIAEKLIKAQDNSDYEIVLDEDGIKQIAGSVSEEMDRLTAHRIEKVEADIAELKRLLVAGVAVQTAGELAPAEAETLVTVSDILPESDEEAEPAEEEISCELQNMPEILADSGDGVDFANMMKYDRSFIARIIQGTDEQKRYYGAIKTALLSYKKVNSNVTWGAERFNKGRETIARLKIRGKTLCLYLALDPAEYKTSVYHHTDVSNNKSVGGTPMLVKIKSPLGVKKAVRLIDEMLEKRGGERKNVPERDYAAMYPYETVEQLIEDGLIKDVSKNK